jgi:hypothetical protein
MKTKSLITMAFALIFASSLAGSSSTVTGVLTDDMCTKKHMMPGKPNADCVRECVKHGAKYVIVADGSIIQVTGKPEQFDALAGKKVTITGETKGKTFFVSTIEAAQ